MADEDTSLLCSTPSGGGGGDVTYDAQCYDLAADHHTVAAFMDIVYALFGDACTYQPSIDFEGEIGGELGGNGGGNGGPGEAQAEGKIDNRYSISVSQSPDPEKCNGVVKAARKFFSRDYLAFQESCLNDPAEYGLTEDDPTPIIMVTTTSSPDLPEPSYSFPPLWSCSMENGTEGQRTTCESTDEGTCCETVSFANTNCQPTGEFMECDCEMGDFGSITYDGPGCGLD
ncbi:MAG: hypothetical protein K0V04_43245 [Deltaproteobacteria bacterium]|nr:hypothetical protein [Deltaproteobacteria bacterium]